MIENNTPQPSTREDYRANIKAMGKKEFTLLKMQEYGFWPSHLPTPYERQASETEENFKARTKLLKDFEKLGETIAKLSAEKEDIQKQLYKLRAQYNDTWDYNKIRNDVAKTIRQESIERRAKRKAEREAERKARTAKWEQKKAEEIVFIGKGYSSELHAKELDETKLSKYNLPLIKTDRELAEFLEIDYKALRFLTYHRDVLLVDHYYRYSIPKRKGGFRQIAAPKSTLKKAQRKILTGILEHLTPSNEAHGFIKGKSVVSGALVHNHSPQLLINMDLENFFPTITFERVRGLFKGLGYSGYIASLLAMLCTYCERMEIEVGGKVRYVSTSKRILPQGSPASPMITNLICRRLDARLLGLAKHYGFTYSRYADDMSFSYDGQSTDDLKLTSFLGNVAHIIKDEDFQINTSKTRILKPHNRQCITGIVVNNDQIGVPKKWVKNLRAAIYNANQFKLEGQTIPSTMLHEIAGKISWLQCVNAERYASIIEQGKILLRSTSNN